MVLRTVSMFLALVLFRLKVSACAAPPASLAEMETVWLAPPMEIPRKLRKPLVEVPLASELGEFAPPATAVKVAVAEESADVVLAKPNPSVLAPYSLMRNEVPFPDWILILPVPSSTAVSAAAAVKELPAKALFRAVKDAISSAP